LQGLDIYTINYAHQISGDVATGDKGSHHLKYPLNKMNTDSMAEILHSLSFPEMLNRRSDIESRHGNTCQWILELEDYKTWRSHSCGLLWMKGNPGAGESTLMVFLHNEHRDSHEGGQGIQLGFFFSAQCTEMQRTPLGMLRSLLCQIFDKDESVRPVVRKIYERKCGQFGIGERK
jgi:hypothetical protein